MADTEPVVVIANFVPVPGKEDEIETALRNAVAATHQHDRGCELYAAHQSIRGREGFVIIEKWSSMEDLQAHGAGNAFAALTTDVADLLAEPLDVTIVKPILAGDIKLGAL
ncbi:antibiotic biosynthesis monooxygenase [Rhodococcus pseudokoreensis]|uniref:Antibiotic biosynthesis monooxygenase n=1 Tax=Rhodococcus pseudokoreensis TaxID=2811421 RepID=A0A974W7G9_9NOCA|nr:antibiotic biosynthesis monooxygenase [Rhodococcus pseudokoreensis]QSE92723.1 antibiotic biosynthesis monooxygenase [Rhodococcus pseudokoreensis]